MRGRRRAAFALALVLGLAAACNDQSDAGPADAPPGPAARTAPSRTPSPARGSFGDAAATAKPADRGAAAKSRRATARPFKTPTVSRTVTPDIALPLPTFAPEELVPVALPLATAAADLLAGLSQPGIEPRLESAFYLRADELQAIEEVHPSEDVLVHRHGRIARGQSQGLYGLVAVSHVDVELSHDACVQDLAACQARIGKERVTSAVLVRPASGQREKVALEAWPSELVDALVARSRGLELEAAQTTPRPPAPQRAAPRPTKTPFGGTGRTLSPGELPADLLDAARGLPMVAGGRWTYRRTQSGMAQPSRAPVFKDRVTDTIIFAAPLQDGSQAFVVQRSVENSALSFGLAVEEETSFQYLTPVGLLRPFNYQLEADADLRDETLARPAVPVDEACAARDEGAAGRWTGSRVEGPIAVTVPAGRFEACCHIVDLRGAAAADSSAYCAGVGLVKRYSFAVANGMLHSELLELVAWSVPQTTPVAGMLAPASAVPGDG